MYIILKVCILGGGLASYSNGAKFPALCLFFKVLIVSLIRGKKSAEKKQKMYIMLSSLSSIWSNLRPP